MTFMLVLDFEEMLFRKTALDITILKLFGSNYQKKKIIRAKSYKFLLIVNLFPSSYYTTMVDLLVFVGLLTEFDCHWLS